MKKVGGKKGKKKHGEKNRGPKNGGGGGGGEIESYRIKPGTFCLEDHYFDQ